MTLPEPREPLWRDSEPRHTYDVVIVGAGAHAVATAYHLASDHGMADVAVLDDGWPTGGNTAVIGATVIGAEATGDSAIGASALTMASATVQRDALKRWARLSSELDHEGLFDRCGALSLAHTPRQVRHGAHRMYANRLSGIPTEWLDVDQVRQLCPPLDVSPDVRHPVLGGTWQPSAGLAEPDAVALAYARCAARLGVDLIRGCSVTGFLGGGDRVAGVRTDLGDIGAGRVALADAGRYGVLVDTVGLRLPVRDNPLRALVSERLAPVLSTVVISDHARVRLSQAGRGELLMDADTHHGYRGRGSVHVIEEQLAAAVELLPILGSVRFVDRWAGTVDASPDGSPIIGGTTVGNLFLSCGWGTGGFAATPTAGRMFAHALATGDPHPLAQQFGSARFADDGPLGREFGPKHGEHRPVTV